MSLLRVLLDGEPLPTEEGIAFWKRFSAWMDEHPGDLGGFASSEGLTSVTPEMHSGAPVLVASRSAAQRPYTSAPTKKEGGPVDRGSPTHAARSPSRRAKTRR
jgi:hypothetical protein